MGKLGTSITIVLILAAVFMGGLLFEQQKSRLMGPFEEYLQFNNFARDVNDLNYYLHGYSIFTQ